LEVAVSKEPERQLDKVTPPSGGILGEFWYFLVTNKKWWLLPILVVLLLFSLLMLLSGSAVAPFIYTLF
jgi:hypothetical protein